MYLLANPVSVVAPVDAVSILTDGAAEPGMGPLRRNVAISIEGSCAARAMLIMQVQPAVALEDRALMRVVSLRIPDTA